MSQRQTREARRAREVPELTGRILVVDDDEGMRVVLRMSLEALGHTVVTAQDFREALGAFEAHPVDVAIVDLKIGTEDGLVLMDRLLERDNELPVIILTANGTISNAVDAVRRGAYSYLTKPFQAEDLSQQVRKALDRRGLTNEISTLRLALEADSRSGQSQMLGRCPAMQQVYRSILQVAPTRATVAIYGESGTGKERVAHAIHAQSPRAKAPFVAVNCAALPDTLLESELFGHMRGAFTDAHHNKMGLFREAEGGTIFLDEIGDTSPALQVSLLRVLQERRVRPLGSETTLPVDVRVIVASNKDLKKEIEEGRFREDLFYRIHILPVHLPPLRERGEDILLLADNFLRRFAREEGREIVGFHPSARESLLHHPWPGNVRELENRIKRAVVLSTRPVLYASDLFDEGSGPSAPAPRATTESNEVELEVPLIPYKEAKEQFEKDYLRRLLKACAGNVSAAARASGRYRADLYALLRKHDLDAGDFK